MANFFGQGIRANSDVVPSSNIRVQSSVQGRPRAIGAGLSRTAGNIIWYNDFAALPQSSGGGKGGGGGSGKGSPTSYNYSASFIVSVGETIDSVHTVYNGNQIDFLVSPPASVLADLEALGITPTYGNTYGATILDGSYSQNPWSYLTSRHPSQALAYRGEALVAFANMGLGSSPTLPNFNFDILWPINSDIPSVGPDANPADWVTAFLTNGDWGAGFPAALLGDLSDYRTWCRATGMLISPLVTSQTAANSHLGDIMQGTIADFRWSSGILSVVPYGNAPVTGNGYTFTPDVTPVYALGVDDFLPYQGSIGNGSSNQTPIATSRMDPQQVLNQVKIEYLDRSNLYNPVTIYDQDDALIISVGRPRPSDLRTQHFFCTASAASMSASLQMRREKQLQQFGFTLPATFILPDVMDIFTLPAEILGSVQAVRITDITENDDRTLNFECEEFLGTVSAPLYARQQTLGTGRNNNVDPGDVNAPILFEPTSKQSYATEVWGAVSGADAALWGGCEIWASYDSAGTYALVATVAGAARTGETTAILPAVGANPNGQTIDNTNTLSVDLTESNGALASGSSSDMTGLNTVCYVDGEIIAYETATLTSANNYDLAPMVRGAYGTPISAHASGSGFARLDDSLFKIAYTPDRIGATLFLKFLSFNIYGGGRQSLADVSPYSYTILGVNQDQLQILNTLTGDGPGSLADTLGQISQVAAQQSDATIDTQIGAQDIKDQNSAAIITEKTARVTAVQANATLIEQAVTQFNTNFANASIRFDVLSTDGTSFATIALMASVGDSGDFIESGIRIFVSIVGGVLQSQIQLLTQNLVITDGTHTAEAFTFDATSGSLVLKNLLMQSIKDIAQSHISLDGNTGAVTFSA